MTVWEIVLESAAITLVFTLGSIFEKVRALWPAFLTCPLCVGVWVGGGVTYMESAPPLQVLGIAALSGVTAFAGYVVIDLVMALAARAEAQAEGIDRAVREATKITARYCDRCFSPRCPDCGGCHSCDPASAAARELHRDRAN